MRDVIARSFALKLIGLGLFMAAAVTVVGGVSYWPDGASPPDEAFRSPGSSSRPRWRPSGSSIAARRIGGIARG